MLSKSCRDFCSRDTILLAGCLVVSGHKIRRDFQSRDTILVNQILRISLFYARFCFELAVGVNMKVLDNFVSFPMDLV